MYVFATLADYRPQNYQVGVTVHVSWINTNIQPALNGAGIKGKEVKSWILVCVLALGLTGCYYFSQEQYADILDRPNGSWNFRECLTVISTPAGNNYFDYRTNIKVSATPYYPAIVFALQRNAQRILHWTESEYRFNVDELMRENNGLYVEWETGKLVDSKGNYFRKPEQIDSMMFLVTINNSAWTSINSKAQVKVGEVTMVAPLISFDQCYIPDITNIQERIFLINDRGKRITAKYVWGRRNENLTNEETLFCMFDWRTEEGHFLKGSRSMQMLIKGFESDIKFTFPTTLIK